MSCYHPIWATPDINPRTNKPYLTKNGKIKYRILGADYEPGRDRLLESDLISFPCGKCTGCRLDYSRQWADRLMLELQYHDSAYFVTLTYNDEHVPRRVYKVDDDTGEAYESLTLDKRDVQLFMKRLRKAFPDDKIRFFLAGEYGPKTFRPHYHAIIFGLHLNDLVPMRKDSRTGFTYYSSPSLERVWSQLVDRKIEKGSIISPYTYSSMGYVTVCNVTWETCAYTARYVTKKLTGPLAKVYTDFDMTPPFSLMSRKPGIARQYYEDHPEFVDQKNIHIPTQSGGRSIRPPKYFEKLLEEDRPELAEQRAEIRAACTRAAIASKLEQSTKSYTEILQDAEDIKIKRTKSLIRRDL